MWLGRSPSSPFRWGGPLPICWFLPKGSCGFGLMALVWRAESEFVLWQKERGRKEENSSVSEPPKKLLSRVMPTWPFALAYRLHQSNYTWREHSQEHLTVLQRFSLLYQVWHLNHSSDEKTNKQTCPLFLFVEQKFKGEVTLHHNNEWGKGKKKWLVEIMNPGLVWYSDISLRRIASWVEKQHL